MSTPPEPIKINWKATILFVEFIQNLVGQITWRLDHIMATQAELTAQLEANAVEIQKIGTETQSLIDKVNELLAQLQNAPVTPELQAAADAVTAQLKIVDDLVPDAPPPGP